MPLERKPSLGLVFILAHVTMARAVKLQPARNFHAPFRLGRIFARAVGHNYGFRDSARLAALGGIDFTEGTAFGVVQQEGATLRADAYHWCVLRRGRSSGTWRSYHDQVKAAPCRMSIYVAD